jgi:hypothetical protein
VISVHSVANLLILFAATWSIVLPHRRGKQTKLAVDSVPHKKDLAVERLERG